MRQPRDDLAVDAVRAAPRPARKPAPSARQARSPRVNIIGPSYGAFNLPSDLAEIRRLVEGIGAEINMVFPLGSHLADVPRLADADVNVCLYREFGSGCARAARAALAAGADRLHSTTSFLRSLGGTGALIPSRSSSARSTPRSSRCGTCGGR